MAAFNGLGHIALKVRDLEASVAFYEKLGFPEFLRLLEDDGAPWIVYMRFDDNLYLELFPGGEGPVETGGTGVHHLSLTVDDIEETERHLARVGIPLEAPRSDKRGLDRNRGMWIADPDGNRIEIMEMAPNCIQWEAIAAMKVGKGKTRLTAPSRPEKVKA
ncbi:MAG: VOC family protein [Devosia sp.]|nr:VOC family protein [Devosia sp.]